MTLRTASSSKTTNTMKPHPKKQKKKTRAPSLREVQDQMQAAILTGDEGVLPLLMDNSRTGRETLFGVYRHAYVARLIDILRHEHEVLHGYLGDDQFISLARAYIAAHPSRNQNARWFAAHLPEYLATTEPYAAHVELAGLAALQRALTNAFDAADAPVLTIANLATVPPEAWANMTFVPHPAVARLDRAANVLAIWLALKDETPPPAVENKDTPERLIVWRHETRPMVRRLEPEEAMLWDEAAKGVPFGVLCEMAATYDDPDTAALRVAQYLQGWIAGGALSMAMVGEEEETGSIATPQKTAE